MKLKICLLISLLLFSFSSCGVLFVNKNKGKNALQQFFPFLALIGFGSNPVDSQPTAPLGFKVDVNTPVPNQTNVKITEKIAISFNNELNPSTVNSTNFTVSSNGNAIIGAIQIFSNTIVFTPSSNMNFSSVYSVTINKSIQDKKGNSLSEDYTFQFTTVSSSDTTSPTLLSSNPIEGDTGVSAFTSITLYFSKNIDSATITTTTFPIQCSGTSQTGNYQVNGNIVTFNPSPNLASLASCNFQATTGIKDIYGNSLNQNYNTNFTTRDNVPPYIVSLSPADGSVGHLINQPIQITFSEDIDMNTVNSFSFGVFLNGVTAVPGSFTYSGKILTFTPSTILTKKSKYLGVLNTLIKDINGNSMQNSYTYSFFTEIPVQIVTGSSHTCALSKLGKMKCWGSNVYGQAGFGDDVFMQTTPKEIPFDAPIQQISAGYYSTCALFVNGNAKCWGNNIYGTLGSSLGVVRNPAQNLYIALQGSILQIETSLFNTCVITDLPSTVCWGGTNYSGYSSSISSSPTINDPYILPDLNLGSSTVSIATGSITGINCAILASNKIKCWGSGAYSQTGLPQSIVTSFSGSVVMPASLSIEYYPHTGFVPESISIGSEHVCMKFTNSKFKCWGRNQAYELIGVSLGSFVWDATTATAYTWDALFGFRKIKAAHLETYLVDSSYKIYYWGWQSSIIINLPISILAQDVAGGSKFGCAIDYLGEEVQCWGDNIFGQLGSGDTVSTEYESPKPSMKIF